MLYLLSWSGNKSALCPRERSDLYRLMRLATQSSLKMIVQNRNHYETGRNKELSLNKHVDKSPIIFSGHLVNLMADNLTQKAKLMQITEGSQIGLISTMHRYSWNFLTTHSSFKVLAEEKGSFPGRNPAKSQIPQTMCCSETHRSQSLSGAWKEASRKWGWRSMYSKVETWSREKVPGFRGGRNEVVRFSAQKYRSKHWSLSFFPQDAQIYILQTHTFLTPIPRISHSIWSEESQFWKISPGD